MKKMKKLKKTKLILTDADIERIFKKAADNIEEIMDELKAFKDLARDPVTGVVDWNKLPSSFVQSCSHAARMALDAYRVHHDIQFRKQEVEAKQKESRLKDLSDAEVGRLLVAVGATEATDKPPSSIRKLALDRIAASAKDEGN